MTRHDITVAALALGSFGWGAIFGHAVIGAGACLLSVALVGWARR